MRWVIAVALCVVACGGSDSSGGRPTGTGGHGQNGPDASCAPGIETCACYGNGTCNPGLICASGLCVSPPGGTGGATGGTGGDSSAGGVAGTGGKLPNGGFPGLGGIGGKMGTGGAGTGGAQQCLKDGFVCDGKPTGCCLGSTCVQDTSLPSVSTCVPMCLTAADCPSGCCATVKGETYKVCAPAIYCPAKCRTAGTNCLDATTSCCSDTKCVYDDPSNTTASCAAVCFGNQDCVSGCCADDGYGTGTSVCSDPVYCQAACLPAGTRPCGLGTPCCAGSYCTSDSINQICLPTCSSPSDCASGCCASQNGSGVYVCSDPSWCPP